MDFDDAERLPFEVQEYRQLTRCVPGIESLYVMLRAVLEAKGAEKVLVVGCGGGAEIEALGDAFEIVGVDPSAEMLAMAKTFATPRTTLLRGTVDDVPASGFDAATSVLVMHFLRDKGAYLDAIRSRLKRGGLFVLVDVCFGADASELDAGGLQKAAFLRHAGLLGLNLPHVADAIKHIPTMPLLSDAETTKLLAAHGFTLLFPFFRGLWYAGWVAAAV